MDHGRDTFILKDKTSNMITIVCKVMGYPGELAINSHLSQYEVSFLHPTALISHIWTILWQSSFESLDLLSSYAWVTSFLVNRVTLVCKGPAVGAGVTGRPGDVTGGKFCVRMFISVDVGVTFKQINALNCARTLKYIHAHTLRFILCPSSMWYTTWTLKKKKNSSTAGWFHMMWQHGFCASYWSGENKWLGWKKREKRDCSATLSHWVGTIKSLDYFKTYIYTCIYAVKSANPSLPTGKAAYPAGFVGSMVGHSTNAGHKKLQGRGYLLRLSYIRMHSCILSYYL